jgi:hypothetical protein
MLPRRCRRRNGANVAAQMSPEDISSTLASSRATSWCRARRRFASSSTRTSSRATSW